MNKFAFIIHPLKLNDYILKFPWMKFLPKIVLSKISEKIPPFQVSKITGIKSRTGKEVEGYFFCCPLSSEQMLSLPEERVLEKIIETAKKAEKMGVDIIGLGSFTSVVGDKGLTIAKEIDTPVTTGNSYTVATGIEGTELAAKMMGYVVEDVTVVGATGSIGRAISLLLAEKGYNIHLVSRSESHLKELQKEILNKYMNTNISYTTDIKNAVKAAKIIITVSGSVESLIDVEDLQAGSVVCDIARPRDVAFRVGKDRKDVLVIEGGVVKIPGDVNFNFDFGFPSGTAYACMAETIMLTLAEKFIDYSLGSKLEVEKVKETAKFAQIYGFELAGLRSFDKALSQEKIDQIRKNVQKL